MSDVIRLILDDHETFRRQFGELDGLRDDPQRAQRVWTGLAALLEMHASAEEEHFYPALLQQVEGSEDETRDAIKDHDEIRDGIRRAAGSEVGSDQWWKAVQDAREANDEHLEEEEHDDLTDALQNFSPQLRSELGEKFQQFKDQHQGAEGLSFQDKDPDRFVEQNR